MRASVLGTGRRLPARARVKVSRSDHFRRQPGRQPACMHCMHKNRLNFSDLCVIMHAEFWLAGWLAGCWLAGHCGEGWRSNARAHALISAMRARLKKNSTYIVVPSGKAV